MKQTVTRAGFKHTGFYKFRPTLQCNIVSLNTVTVLIATAVFLALLDNFPFTVSQEYLRNIFKPIMRILNRHLNKYTYAIETMFRPDLFKKTSIVFTQYYLSG